MVRGTQTNRPLAIATALGEDALLLTAISGDEELSTPFRYELDMLSEDHDVDPTAIVGTPVTIRVAAGEEYTRYFNGIVGRFSHVGWSDIYSSYRATLVPSVWFLDHNSDCRIFEDKSAKDIVSAILKQHGITDVKWNLKSDPPKREYCVQYRETDLNFVSRLLEEEGIFYFFQHTNGKHTLVLGDSSSAYFQLEDSEVEYPDPAHDYGGMNRVTSWQRSYSFLSGNYTHTAYNFKTPSTSLVRDQAKQKLKFKHVDKLETYDYHGRHEDPARGKALAKIRMEEIEARHDIAQGQSTCGSFSPGGKFKFIEHRNESEIGKSYALTRVHVSARQENYTTDGSAFSFSNSFECIPVDVPFRPQRRARKPVVEGPQTAIIVGPEGEIKPKGKGKDKEIYVDEHARVKVRFHWIRDGEPHGENSSCWMRVSQAWGGNGYGGMNIPRIGHEVIVDFLEGDPDHPIINGRVYNAESMPNSSNAGRDVASASGGGPKYPGNSAPSDIPAAAMMTSFKSSSVGGSGSNEITMNDEGGKEGLMFKAQKDEIHTVGNDREDSVANDESRSVGNNRFRSVGVDETIQIGNNQDNTIGVNKTTNVGTAHSETVGVSQDISIGTSQSTNVGSTQSNSVGISQSNTVGVIKNESVGVSSSEQVGVTKSITAGAVLSLASGVSMSTEVGSSSSESVGKKKSVDVGEEISIVCGASKLLMKKDGTISLEGKDIVIKGSGKITIKAASDMVLKASKIGQN